MALPEDMNVHMGGERMKLGRTYICVSDMEKSLEFYKKLL